MSITTLPPAFSPYPLPNSRILHPMEHDARMALKLWFPKAVIYCSVPRKNSVGNSTAHCNKPNNSYGQQSQPIKN